MRTESRADSRLFGELLRSLLKEGIAVQFQARGRSMFPAIEHGHLVQVNPKPASSGDVALVSGADGLRVHRVLRTPNGTVTQGDCCFGEDPYPAELLGSVSFERGRHIPRQRLGSRVRRWIARWRGHF